MQMAAEIVVILLLVLLCFSGFLGLLNIIFPTGASLTALVKGGVGSPGDLESTALPGPQLATDGGDTNERTKDAVLTDLRNDVKSKRSASIAWGRAQTGMKLFNRDAVQTLGKSGARIVFDGENYLTMGSNSLVIIKRMEKDPWLDQQQSFMVMVEGELSGRIATTAQNTMRVEVTTPDAVARFKPGKETGQEAEFKVSINPDQSASVVVFNGTAEVTAGGRIVAVGANQGVTIVPGEGPPVPEVLPEPPTLTGPADGSLSAYRHLSPRVKFAWEAPAGVERFKFQLATDQQFETLLVEENLKSPAFTHGSLKNGSYFWRVSSVRDGCEGLASQAQRLELVQDLAPPRLEVAFPEQDLDTGQLALRGITEPGARVFVDGTEILPDGLGKFSCGVPLKKGINPIVVEAVDAVGNIAYSTGVVQRKY